MIERQFFIKGREISSNLPPYVIAEVSANHNGSIARAKQTILAAKTAGVDAVKIQTYTPDTMTIDVEHPDFFISEGLWKGKTLYELYGEAFTPFEWHGELFSYAEEIGVTLFSSPFDESAVDLLEKFNVAAYKIASFEIVDLPLIKYVAKKNKPILISTGMASYEEIGDALESARSMGNYDVALFHCISSYPTPLADASLKYIAALRKEFNVQIGLSDHTIGNLASVVATSLGASIIEKHFTLNRSDGGVDSSFSLEPDEMRSLVEDTKEVHTTLGAGVFERPSAEKSNKVFRRSLYFVKDVKQGEILTENNIRRIRPGFGLEAKHYETLIGTKCCKAAKRGERLTWKHVELKNH